MSYASGTTHYNLPQTVGTDKRDWTDTNQAFSDVDTALYGAVQDAETATSGIQTINAALEVIDGKLATDEGNISTLSGKVSTLESTVGTQGTAIADVRQDLQDNIESHTEASATSTHAYNVGDTFYYNDVLYRATAPIAIGGTIVPSTNCTAITVMSEVNALIQETATVEITASDTFGSMATKIKNAIDQTKVTAKTVIVDATGSVWKQDVLGKGFSLVSNTASRILIEQMWLETDTVLNNTITAPGGTPTVEFNDVSNNTVSAAYVGNVTIYY